GPCVHLCRRDGSALRGATRRAGDPARGGMADRPFPAWPVRHHADPAARWQRRRTPVGAPIAKGVGPSIRLAVRGSSQSSTSLPSPRRLVGPLRPPTPSPAVVCFRRQRVYPTCSVQLLMSPS